MRICYFISGDLWGGAEAQVYQLIKRVLDDTAHEVHAITLNSGALFSKLSDLPVKTQLYDESASDLLSLIIKLWRYLRKNRINLVHCHGFKENLIAGIACLFLPSVKVVRTHHGRGVVTVSSVKRIIEMINAKYLTSVLIAVSSELRNFLIALGYPENKITVIRNGVDCNQLEITKEPSSIRQEYGIQEDVFVVGTASRIEYEKGYQYLLSTIKYLTDQQSHIVLFIIGDGSLQEKFRQMAIDMGIDKVVIFAGFKSDVINYLNMYDAFVMMSLNEGIPIALIEAMCLAKPVVSSSVGGIPEVIDSGKNGLLVDSGDAKACSESILNIINDSEFRNFVSSNAKDKAESVFSAGQCAVNTIQLYETVVK